MKCCSCPRITRGLYVAGNLLLAGCATGPQSLYYWGNYQPEVYSYFVKDQSPEQQIAILEAGLEEARAMGKPVPPGYNAHLGLVYGLGEHRDQMLKYFEAERTLYPEGKLYMDFLGRKFKPAK